MELAFDSTGVNVYSTSGGIKGNMAKKAYIEKETMEENPYRDGLR